MARQNDVLFAISLCIPPMHFDGRQRQLAGSFGQEGDLLPQMTDHPGIACIGPPLRLIRIDLEALNSIGH